VRGGHSFSFAGKDLGFSSIGVKKNDNGVNAFQVYTGDHPQIISISLCMIRMVLPE